MNKTTSLQIVLATLAAFTIAACSGGSGGSGGRTFTPSSGSTTAKPAPVTPTKPTQPVQPTEPPTTPKDDIGLGDGDKSALNNDDDKKSADGVTASDVTGNQAPSTKPSEDESTKPAEELVAPNNNAAGSTSGNTSVVAPSNGQGGADNTDASAGDSESNSAEVTEEEKAKADAEAAKAAEELAKDSAGDAENAESSSEVTAPSTDNVAEAEPEPEAPQGPPENEVHKPGATAFCAPHVEYCLDQDASPRAQQLLGYLKAIDEQASSFNQATLALSADNQPLEAKEAPEVPRFTRSYADLVNSLLDREDRFELDKVVEDYINDQRIASSEASLRPVRSLSDADSENVKASFLDLAQKLKNNVAVGEGADFAAETTAYVEKTQAYKATDSSNGDFFESISTDPKRAAWIIGSARDAEAAERGQFRAAQEELGKVTLKVVALEEESMLGQLEFFGKYSAHVNGLRNFYIGTAEDQEGTGYDLIDKRHADEISKLIEKRKTEAKDNLESIKSQLAKAGIDITADDFEEQQPLLSAVLKSFPKIFEVYDAAKSNFNTVANQQITETTNTLEDLAQRVSARYSAILERNKVINDSLVTLNYLRDLGATKYYERFKGKDGSYVASDYSGFPQKGVNLTQAYAPALDRSDFNSRAQVVQTFVTQAAAANASVAASNPNLQAFAYFTSAVGLAPVYEGRVLQTVAHNFAQELDTADGVFGSSDKTSLVRPDGNGVSLLYLGRDWEKTDSNYLPTQAPNVNLDHYLTAHAQETDYGLFNSERKTKEVAEGQAQGATDAVLAYEKRKDLLPFFATYGGITPRATVLTPQGEYNKEQTWAGVRGQVFRKLAQPLILAVRAKIPEGNPNFVADFDTSGLTAADNSLLAKLPQVIVEKGAPTQFGATAYTDFESENLGLSYTKENLDVFKEQTANVTVTGAPNTTGASESSRRSDVKDNHLFYEGADFTDGNTLYSRAAQNLKTTFLNIAALDSKHLDALAGFEEKLQDLNNTYDQAAGAYTLRTLKTRNLWHEPVSASRLAGYVQGRHALAKLGANAPLVITGTGTYNFADRIKALTAEGNEQYAGATESGRAFVKDNDLLALTTLYPDWQDSSLVVTGVVLDSDNLDYKKAAYSLYEDLSAGKTPNYSDSLNQERVLQVSADNSVTSLRNIVGDTYSVSPDHNTVGCGVLAFHCLAAPSVLPWVGLNGSTVTSLATGGNQAALVGAAAALVAEQFPFFTANQIKQTLLTTATDLGAPGVDKSTGWGLLNVASALRGPKQFLPSLENNAVVRASGQVIPLMEYYDLNRRWGRRDSVTTPTDLFNQYQARVTSPFDGQPAAGLVNFSLSNYATITATTDKRYARATFKESTWATADGGSETLTPEQTIERRKTHEAYVTTTLRVKDAVGVNVGFKQAFAFRNPVSGTGGLYLTDTTNQAQKTLLYLVNPTYSGPTYVKNAGLALVQPELLATGGHSPVTGKFATSLAVATQVYDQKKRHQSNSRIRVDGGSLFVFGQQVPVVELKNANLFAANSHIEELYVHQDSNVVVSVGVNNRSDAPYSEVTPALTARALQNRGKIHIHVNDPGLLTAGNTVVYDAIAFHDLSYYNNLDLYSLSPLYSLVSPSVRFYNGDDHNFVLRVGVKPKVASSSRSLTATSLAGFTGGTQLLSDLTDQVAAGTNDATLLDSGLASLLRTKAAGDLEVAADNSAPAALTSANSSTNPSANLALAGQFANTKVYGQAGSDISTLNSTELYQLAYRAGASVYADAQVAQVHALETSAQAFARSALVRFGRRLNDTQAYADYGYDKATWTQNKSLINGAVETQQASAGVFGAVKGYTYGVAGHYQKGSFSEAFKTDKAVFLGSETVNGVQTDKFAPAGKQTDVNLASYDFNQGGLHLALGTASSTWFFGANLALAYAKAQVKRTLVAADDVTSSFNNAQAQVSFRAGAQLLGDARRGLSLDGHLTGLYSYQYNFSEAVADQAAALTKALAFKANSAHKFNVVTGARLNGVYSFSNSFGATSVNHAFTAALGLDSTLTSNTYQVEGVSLTQVNNSDVAFKSGYSFNPGLAGLFSLGYGFKAGQFSLDFSATHYLTSYFNRNAANLKATWEF